MKIADKTVLVTGVNRGIGQALVEEALRRDAKRVYAVTRQTRTHSDEPVILLTLDVTNAAQIQEAVEKIGSLDILVNNVSMMALAPFPITPAYSISKAAFNLTQSLRLLLAGQGVRVHAVLTGPTDTDMTRGLDLPKAPPQSVARAIFDGVEADKDDILPDPMSESVADSWRSGLGKTLEREYTAFVPAKPHAAERREL